MSTAALPPFHFSFLPVTADVVSLGKAVTGLCQDLPLGCVRESHGEGTPH